MKIIFISTTCARSDYEKICEKRKVPMLDSSQKFFEMFLGGFLHMDDVTVDCITIPPISRGTYPGNYIPPHMTTDKNITYHYVSVWNFSVLKSLFATYSVKRILKKLMKGNRNEETYLICDPLLLEGLSPTVRIGCKYGITTLGFLTDMPNFANECDGHRRIKKMLYEVYNQMICKKIKMLDKFVVLTEAMSCIAEGKPWLLLDCIVDDDMLSGLGSLAHDEAAHVIYAGKLHREFGMDVLNEAMRLVKNDCVFDIYGDGNYAEELRNTASKCENIKMHGIVPLKEVLKAELSADILINPRTSEGEYTKYSFPSKTAEYMLAGVPVVMFHLPGISSQYDQYICFAKEENAQALARKIDEILSMDKSERAKLGTLGREFVLNNKNNKMQAERVKKFLEELIYE